MTTDEEFLRRIAEKGVIRPCVRALIFHPQRADILVEQNIHEPGSYYSFPGGEYELGDSMVGRLGQELQEETDAELLECRYLFVAENLFYVAGKLVHSLEHYFEAVIDRDQVESREAHLTHHWLPIEALYDFDLRPLIVRDHVMDGSYHALRHIFHHEQPAGGIPLE